MEWTDEKTFLLIALYEANPCLYDVSITDYHSRNKKKLAIEKIAAELKTVGAEVTKKVKNLRTHFGDELRKQCRTKSGQGAGDAYVSKWKYFRALNFLSAHVHFNRPTFNNHVELAMHDTVASDDQGSVTDIEEETDSLPTANGFQEELNNSSNNNNNSNNTETPKPAVAVHGLTYGLKRKRVEENAYDRSLSKSLEKYLDARTEAMKSKLRPTAVTTELAIPQRRDADEDDRAFIVLVDRRLRAFSNRLIKGSVQKAILDAIFDGEQKDAELQDKITQQEEKKKEEQEQRRHEKEIQLREQEFRARQQEIQCYYMRGSNYNVGKRFAFPAFYQPPPPPPTETRTTIVDESHHQCIDDR